MNCHSQIWADSPTLEPVRESFRSGEAIRWTRVHDLPHFAFFNHSIHVKKGIGCESCHGRVDQMPLVWRQHSLQMEWCLDCHRDPAKHVRPREEIVTMGWVAPEGQAIAGPALAREYDVKSLENCSVCHR